MPDRIECPRESDRLVHAAATSYAWSRRSPEAMPEAMVPPGRSGRSGGGGAGGSGTPASPSRAEPSQASLVRVTSSVHSTQGGARRRGASDLVGGRAARPACGRRTVGQPRPPFSYRNNDFMCWSQRWTAPQLSSLGARCLHHGSCDSCTYLDSQRFRVKCATRPRRLCSLDDRPRRSGRRELYTSITDRPSSRRAR